MCHVTFARCTGKMCGVIVCCYLCLGDSLKILIVCEVSRGAYQEITYACDLNSYIISACQMSLEVHRNIIYACEVSLGIVYACDINREIMYICEKHRKITYVRRDLLRHPPSSAWKNEDLKNIPLLIGSASQAVDFWPGPDDLATWTWNQYKKYVTTSLDSFGLQVSQMALRIYNGTALQSNNSNFTAEYLYTTMVSDIRQSCPVNTLANQLSQIDHPYIATR
ncbi:neurotactin [Caerostris extrusa]|uniref:Neurotactin n=1 Tax=Caerostris extrusa TaxID=172846 RepID=A0AAV4UGV8_CAEEX|nr:neurotactin [Caerostris extrusa]